ncbi:MAG: DUF2064 domain-containing protein [Bacteroidota bacterium]
MKSPLPHHTAILVFANSSSEELRHKTFTKDGLLFQELTKHTLKTVKQTKLPYFHISEQQQQGNSFGERFTNAIQSIFNKGYEQVITLGNDTPQLKKSHILSACEHLNKGKSVLGPSTDGGFYLMGIHKSQFKPQVFTTLSWQTSVLAQELLETLDSSSCKTVKLGVLSDIDRVSDVAVFLNSYVTIPRRLLQIIRSILNIQEKSFHYIDLLLHTYSIKYYFNKGSPSLFSATF